MTKGKGGGGERVSTCNESDKLATGGVKVRKDSCITQKCTGIAISLGFISCKEMGRERKGMALWKRGSPSFIIWRGRVSMSQPSLPFSPPSPPQATLLMPDLHTS